MTQAALARATGLSPATVSNIVRELRGAGTVDAVRGSAGRRGVQVLCSTRRHHGHRRRGARPGLGRQRCSAMLTVLMSGPGRLRRTHDRIHRGRPPPVGSAAHAMRSQCRPEPRTPSYHPNGGFMRTHVRRAPGALAVTLLAAGLAAAGCGSSNSTSSSSSTPSTSGSASAGKSGTIALLLPETKTTRYESADRPFFTDKMKALCADCKVVYSNANQDAALQQNQADQAMTNGAKILVLDPVDSASAASIVAKAKAQNVQVVSYDRLITSAPIDYFVGFDSVKVGQLQGQALLDKLTKDGTATTGQIVWINGAPTDNNAKQFKQGAHS